MSYIDVAEAYLHQDWSTALNSYWSPLYSWLLALAFAIIKPSPYWKFSVLHLVNFAIYLFALGCVDFLLQETSKFHRSREEAHDQGFVFLPQWAWTGLGIPLFIWLALYVNTVAIGTPDLIVAGIVYLSCGLLLRRRRRGLYWLNSALLGIALGVGYLAKAVMFPLALVFLFVDLVAAGNLRRGLSHTLLAFLFFIVIAAPFVLALSQKKGRFTFGDAGKLNYAWAINKVPRSHWQGNEDAPGNGVPKHATRKVFDSPPIYEFGDPVGGTYPVWYDPSYWYEGVVTRFAPSRQIKAILGKAAAYYELFFFNVSFGLLTGFLTLYLVSRRKWRVLRDLAPYSSSAIPALAGLGIYSVVAVEARYIAPFVMLFWLALFSAARLPNSLEAKRLVSAVATSLVLLMVINVTASSKSEAFLTIKSLTTGENVSSHEHWRVARGLNQMGVYPGERVAFLGQSAQAYWANLASVRIVAEIEDKNVGIFWAADESLKIRMIETFRRTGAKVIVTQNPPPNSDAIGWKRIADTSYYVYWLG